MREIRGFFLAPLPAAVLAALVSWSTGAHPRPVSIVIFVLLLFYAVQLVIGVLIRALLVRHNMTSRLFFSLGGLAMTAIPAVPYIAWAPFKQGYAPSFALITLVLVLAYGAITGLTYWRLARPDQQVRRSR
jgi:hypothetical protein